MQLLEPEMLLEKQKNEMKRPEAWRVYGEVLVSSYFSMIQNLVICDEFAKNHQSFSMQRANACMTRSRNVIVCCLHHLVPLRRAMERLTLSCQVQIPKTRFAYNFFNISFLFFVFFYLK